MPSDSTTTAPVTPSAEPDDPPVKRMKCASVKSRYLVKQVSGTTSSSARSVRAQLDKYLSYDHGELSVNDKGEVQEINAFDFWAFVARQQRKAELQNGRTAEQSNTPEGLQLTTHKS